MLTYKDLYEKDVWTIAEIKEHVGYSRQVISIAGTLMREKILIIEDPLKWTAEIDLLCELYSTIIQVFYHFDEITNSQYEEDDKTIHVSFERREILRAFSNNVEICQKELEKQYMLFLSPHVVTFN